MAPLVFFPIVIKTKIEETPKKIKTTDMSLSYIKRSKIQLRPFQIEACLQFEQRDELFLIHNTGAGKTLTAITISQGFLDKDPKHTVLFVSPPALIDNFKKEMRAYGLETTQRYTFLSYTKAKSSADNLGNLKNTLVICDEVHNLKSSKRDLIRVFIETIKHSKKRLLLSATPFVNSVNDLLTYAILLNPKIHFDETLFKKKRGMTDYTEFLNRKVHYVNILETPDFPTRIDVETPVMMTEDYYREYKQALAEDNKIFKGDQKAFYNGARRAVNMLGEKYFSVKLQKILECMDQKSLIYTNWIDFGIRGIENLLKENNIKFASITGDTKNKSQIVDQFNNNEFKVLLISKVGGEGIDLKEVRNVIVVDPPWNDTGLTQIIGRAIRFGSHRNLQKEERTVRVINLILTSPQGEDPSGDQILYNIIREKKHENEELLHFYKKWSVC